MLLTLLKITFFFGIVLAAALGAMHLAESGHPVQVVFNGVEYTFGPVQAAVAAIVLMIGGWLVVQILRLVLAFIRFLAGDKTAINRYFDRARERKGYQALAEGMLAVASGEGRLAQDQAARAAKYLDAPHLTNILAAQAAEAAGDANRADEIYRTMLADNRTRFVGIRGLMTRQIALGDTDKALKLAEKAYALKPGHTEVQDKLLALQTQGHDWKGARQTLKDKRKQGALPQDVHLRRDSVLALQEASEVLAAGNSISAREAAISANRASPDLVPAAVLAARSYMAQKDTRNAARLLHKAWTAQPHPSLAAAYAEIVPDETPAQRMRRFEDLIRANPAHEESRLLEAELALAAEDFPAARRALGTIAETHPTVRSLAIMAAVERGEGADDSLVRGWLARAMNASRGPQWVCDKCHNVMSDWAPVCDSCGAFDTLTWREPDQPLHVASAGNGVEMLPLIVGRPRPVPDDEAPLRLDAARVQPGMVEDTPPVHPAQTPPHPVGPRPAAPNPADTPQVAPGMVPRESDYAPSMTITDPEEPSAPRTGTLARTLAGLRPAEPEPETPAAPPVIVTVKEVAPLMSDELGNPPVRPDVEPMIEQTSKSR